MSIATKITHLGPAGAKPTVRLLLGHATGFCKEMWDPFVEDLGRLFAQDASPFAATVVALDWSNHGDSRATADPGAWDQFCPEDVSAVADGVLSAGGMGGTPLVGIGHSMGGAGLCLAALQRPTLFSKLILFEPVIPSYADSALKAFEEAGKMLSSTAARRRGQWASREEALTYFKTRGLMAPWDDRSVRAYVRGAIRDTPEGCALKCPPLVEAKVYARPPDMVERLPGLPIPVQLLAGSTSMMFPTSHWTKLAGALPRGSFEMVEGGHFWPYEQPAAFAALVHAQLAALARPSSL